MRSSVGRKFRSFVSFVALTVGVLLLPLGIVAGWAQSTLGETTGFVRTFAPLSTNARVHTLVIDTVTDTLSSTLTTQSVNPGLSHRLDESGVSDATKDAIRTQLSELLMQAQSQLKTELKTLTASKAFDSVWRSTLTASHRQAIDTLNGVALPEGKLAPNGALGVQTQPLARSLRDGLSSAAPQLAALIPVSPHTVAVTPARTVDRLRPWYHGVQSLSGWGCLGGAICCLGGVLLARRRGRASIVAATCMLLLLALVWALPSILAPAAQLAGSEPALILLDTISPSLNAALAPWALGLAIVLVVISVAVIISRHHRKDA